VPEERKLVTILFADVTGSTALGENLDPEDVRALMSRYYEHARRVIADHGGTLEKFIGDAVMAVFGLPIAHGNDAERACAATLALHVAIASDSLLAERLLLRSGVNTGEVVATRDPSAADATRGDFLVTGDAVNVAARLQQAANPGEILAGERTVAAARASFHFGAARSVVVKGKSHPLAVFPLVGPRPARERSRPALVGRRRELAQLALLRDAALEERHPQLVSIVAPAGTGKTRLLEEFLAGLDPAEGWQVATARCLPYGQSLTYWPLRGLLDDLLGTAFSPERVREAFAGGGHSAEDAERLAGLLLSTLGVEQGGGPGQQVERDSTFQAWRLFVEALSRQAPRIIVFEDLHWASESLLDLVEHVTHPRTRAALVNVVLSRPELLDRRPAWGGGMRNFTALALDALSEARTQQLIDQLVPPGVSTEAGCARIVERSGGNPFFAIELARGLAERLAHPAAPGEPGAAGERASAGTEAPPKALPETVHEAVLARLDLLPDAEREVLQVAAVTGRTFRPPTLQAALPKRDPAAIATALEGLLARDVLVLAEGEADAYTFRHILFRDVAYGTLTRTERIRLHLAVATWLEGFARERLDEFVELLAYHYREAVLLTRQSAVPLGVAADVERAVGYLVRAGELASRAGLLGPAVAYLRAAITLAPVEEHLRLYELLGDCAVRGEAAVEGYRRALSVWREQGEQGEQGERGERGQPDLLSGARLLRKLLYVYWGWVTSQAPPSPQELAALHAEALRLAEEAGDEDELWRVRIAPLNPLVRTLSREELERERDICAAAVAHFERRQDWPALFVALDTYAGYAQRLGAYEEALAASRRCLEWPDLPASARGMAQSMLGKVHLCRGEYDACLAMAQNALAQVRPGDPLEPLLAESVKDAAHAAYLGGRWSELEGLRQAAELIREEVQQAPGLHVVGFRLLCMILLAVALAREDRVAADAAATLLERVMPPSYPLAPLVRALAAAYLADDPARFELDDPARRQTGSMWWELEYLAEHGIPAPAWMIQNSREGMYDANRALADIAEALTSGDDVHLAAAIDAAEARHLIPLTARMRIVLAQRTGDVSQLERARPVLERLGDRQFLRRLEEVGAALG
jgi:class 3 adenylate cyclase/tetratricopeptide (TPR) repeat protein